MPHLFFGGRYWRASGDDLPFPAFCAAFLRAFWTCLLITIICLSAESLVKCNDGWIIMLFLSLSLAVCIFAIICEVCIGRHSLRGTPIDQEKRHGLLRYLTLHSILGIFQMILSLFGIVIISNHQIPCSEGIHEENVPLICLSIVVISQLIDVLSLVCCCFMLSKSHDNQEMDDEMAVELWQRRCQTCMRAFHICCCNILGGGGNVGDELEAVGRAFTTIFHHDGFLDVTPSDVIAGLLLLRMEQREENSTASRRLLRFLSTNANPTLDKVQLNILEEGNAQPSQNCPPRPENGSRRGHRILKIENIEDRDLLQTISRCSVFALSIYTHLFYIFLNPLSGPCSLCGHAIFANGCLHCSKKSSNQISLYGVPPTNGDNCCSLHFAGAMAFTRHLHSKLIYASFESTPLKKPYAVFLDLEHKHIIITIRGTLTLEDWITNALHEPTEMIEVGEKWGFSGKGKWAHGGWVAAADWIRRDIEEKKIIQTILDGPDMPPDFNLNSHLVDGLPSEPNIFITGHSQGAALATLLAIFMKSAYPNVKCIGFGVPGTLDRNFALDCSSFVTSVALNNDLVCHLGFHSVSRLRYDVLDALCRAKVSKTMIMQSVLNKKIEVRDYLHPRGQAPHSKFHDNVSRFQAKMNAKALQLQLKELVLPGRIIHFVKTKQNERQSCCQATNNNCSSSVYVPMEAFQDDFSEIAISSSMALDHFPNRYMVEAYNALGHSHYR